MYRPSQQSVDFYSGAKRSRDGNEVDMRILRVVAMPLDPLEPPKLKHKRVPKASGSPPVPVMHSPPRPMTVKDQLDWRIPPCISNWKNPQRFTIPLDKQLAAEGRGLLEVQVNEGFAKLSEALYLAEQKAREAIEIRFKVQMEMLTKEKERKEQQLRDLARKAMETLKESEQGLLRERERERERIREERRRERKRERNLLAKDVAMGKKNSKVVRDRDRDVSEKVALGMASFGGGGRAGEVTHDARLFNQKKGMDSGFATDGDQYNVYDKGLFTAQPTLSTLYRPKKDADAEIYGANADEQLEKIRKTDRFKPDKAFAGTSERSGTRDGPVKFEKEAEEADPFGLDRFMTKVKKGRK
ncbi:hypothetical protein CICLE_v10012059mg [Citrus x clementina]|uniref:SKI-interacting protein SKIP SNW domain-containing protein n=2 Tax=Citrus clementina TaxID=85681 RepID=V4T340_CITCL|nr:hypothetical protein CICLE_v10012059mg [Citrus x clementina]